MPEERKRPGRPGPRKVKRAVRLNPGQDEQIAAWSAEDGVGYSETLRGVVDLGIDARLEEER